MLTTQYDGRRVVTVYFTSVNCNSLNPLRRLAVNFLHNLFSQLSSINSISADSASRGPSAVADIIVCEQNKQETESQDRDIEKPRPYDSTQDTCPETEVDRLTTYLNIL